VPKFLSDEWVAQARVIQEEYKGKGTPPAAAARINLTITEVPIEVSEGPIAAKIDTTDGAADLDLGNFDSPDASISLEYDTAKAFLVEGNPQVVMQAVMSGKVKISGDMTKVLALQQGAPDEVALEMGARLRDITD
jgi:putative sterol carrier protein